MKMLVILVCAAIAAAAPQGQHAASNGQEVEILQFDSNNDGLGNYNFVFDLSDGTKREERGELRNAGTKDEFIAVKGSYGWVDPNGEYRIVSYIADDKGYKTIVEQGSGGIL